MTPTRSRGNSRDRRGREFKKATPRIFLAVDGESEKKYFQRYQRSRSDVSLTIVVIGKVGPRQILNKCKRSMKEYGIGETPGDCAAIVTDVDANTKEGLLEL